MVYLPPPSPYPAPCDFPSEGPVVVSPWRGVNELLLCGETPGPPDARVLKTSLKESDVGNQWELFSLQEIVIFNGNHG